MAKLWFGLLAVATSVVVPAQVAAQDGMDAARNAYSYALRCFAANSVATSDKRYNPNGRNDAALKQGAYRAYNAAQVMGSRLGYSKSRIADDLTKSGNVEGTLMLRDDGYFQRARADCQKLGML